MTSNDNEVLLCSVLLCGGLLCGIGLLLWKAYCLALYQPIAPGFAQRCSDNPVGWRSPREHGIRCVEVQLRATDATELSGWWMEHPGASVCLVFCHATHGNVGSHMQFIRRLVELPVHLLAVEYRGFGNSAPLAPDEAGLILDVEAGYRYARNRCDKVGFVGQGLGAAAAVKFVVNLKSRFPARPCPAVLCDSPVDSSQRLMADILPVPGGRFSSFARWR
mmetsp:Transcript_12923/g.29154  ORF Transcript_12923/g.29154 Transcript_12923/m.29154 type:complete len:220 (-) Transcript_12923:469-1128(-)